MTPPASAGTKGRTPGLSIIMPCYNEEEMIQFTIPRIAKAFERAGYDLELVAVDNGSRDRTGEIIKQFARAHPSVVHHRVEVNQGYGNGVLEALPVCTAPLVGCIPADGQVDAEDLVRLYETTIATEGWVITKVRRRFRMDGVVRKIVSICFNAFFRLLWPSIRSIDINGNPRILPREAIALMNLESKGWLIDAEILVKGHYLGLRIVEHNVFARMRGNGLSHIRASSCWEFFRNLLVMRFTGRWKHQVAGAPRRADDPSRAQV